MGKTTTKKRWASKKASILIMKKPRIKEKPVKKALKLTIRDLLSILFLMTLGFIYLVRAIYDLPNKPENIIVPNLYNKDASISNGYRDVESYLQRQFENFVDEMYATGNIKPEERTAWLAYDLIKKEPIISINADIPMQSASMIKPFVALAFFHKVDKGELKQTKESDRFLRLMIKHSWNTATNWLMKQIGGPEAVNDLLYEFYPDIFQQTEIVEYIPPGGLTYKNKASANDYNRFLNAVWNGELPFSDEIKRLMGLSNPGRSGQILPDTEVAHKSGTTARMCGDMAILESKCKKGDHAYAFIAIIERDDSVSDYLRWRRIKINVIRKASSMVYDAMKETYKYI